MPESKTDKEKRNREFLEFLAACREAWEAGVRANLAFWLGIWYGDTEKSRGRAVRDDEPATEFAFELGVQLKPVWKEIDGLVRRELVAAAVGLILGSIGLKR